MEIRPIAKIYTDFGEKFGVPRQSGRVEEAFGKIVFEPEYRRKEALRGMEGFSHLWLIFDFSKAHRQTWSPTVRPPRLGGNTRVGVFASRSPFRPNPLGLSCVKLLSVGDDPEYGGVLFVGGVDLIDGTPIFDIKPYIPYADCRPNAVGGYADAEKDHRLTVSDPEGLIEKLPEEKRSAALSCIADDPRPAYRDDPDRIYGMDFAGFDIRFTVSNGEATLREIEKNAKKDGLSPFS